MLTSAIYNTQRNTASDHFFKSSEFYPLLFEPEPEEEPEPIQDHRGTILDAFWVDAKTAYKMKQAKTQGVKHE